MTSDDRDRVQTRGYVQVTRCRGILLRGICQIKGISRRRLQVDDHRVGAEIGVRSNDRAAQAAIVIGVRTCCSGGRVVRPIDIKRGGFERQHEAGSPVNRPRNCDMLPG